MKTKIKRTVTPKKLEANRKNSLKSTGPSTKEGKEKSRFNALKHGILAKEAIIRDGDGKEPGNGIQEVLSSLIDDYKPRGAIEHMLVERIAQAYWRLHRAQRAEVGEIQKKNFTGWSNATREKRATFWKEINAPHDPENPRNLIAYDYLNSQYGLETVVPNLETALKEIEEEGEISQEVLRNCRHHFKDSSFLSTLEASKTKENIKEIKRHLEHFGKELIHYKVHETGQVLATMDASLVPQEATGGNLLRYETAIERQMYRAIRELQRLQEIRHKSIKRFNYSKRSKHKHYR
jgi:hypothetical protein